MLTLADLPQGSKVHCPLCDAHGSTYFTFNHLDGDAYCTTEWGEVLRLSPTMPVQRDGADYIYDHMLHFYGTPGSHPTSAPKPAHSGDVHPDQ